MFGWLQAAISLHNRHDLGRVLPNEHHAAAADLRPARADLRQAAENFRQARADLRQAAEDLRQARAVLRQAGAAAAVRNLLRSTCRLFDRASLKQATQKGDAVVRIRLRLLGVCTYAGLSQVQMPWGQRLSAGTLAVFQPLFCQMAGWGCARCSGI